MFPLVIAVALAAVPAAPASPTLTGTVLDGQDRPLASATVFIRTAGPRKGVGVL